MYTLFYRNVRSVLQNTLAATGFLAVTSVPPVGLAYYLSKREHEAIERYEADKKNQGYNKVQTGHVTVETPYMLYGLPVMKKTERETYVWQKVDDKTSAVETEPYCRL